MGILKRKKKKDTIAIALLITISFLHQFPAGDFYDNQGIDLKILPESYKKNVIEVLRQEFLMI